MRHHTRSHQVAQVPSSRGLRGEKAQAARRRGEPHRFRRSVHQVRLRPVQERQGRRPAGVLLYQGTQEDFPTAVSIRQIIDEHQDCFIDMNVWGEGFVCETLRLPSTHERLKILIW